MKKLFNIIFLFGLSIILISCTSSTIEEHNLLISELQDQSAAQIYERAEKEFNRTEYANAIKTYEALNSLYPFSPYSEKALFYSVRCHYNLEEQMEDTIKVADRFILLYPDSTHIEEVWYLKAKAYYHQTHHWILRRVKSDLSKRDISALPYAEQSCIDLLEQFPNTVYREKVEKRLKKIRHMLADYEYHIALYYFEKEAYLAALNRGIALREKYAGTPAAERVMAVIKDAQTHLGVKRATES